MIRKIIFTILIGIIFIQSVALATEKSSANYKITSDSFDAGVDRSTSSSYKLLSELKERDLQSLTGTSYILEQGFKPSAYFGDPYALAIISINPENGYNIAPVRIAITGRNFLSGATVKLTAADETDIIGQISTLSATEISCEFDIAGKNPGAWNVVVMNPDGESASLASAFEIKKYQIAPAIALNSPNPFNPRTEGTTIMYNLENATDIKIYILTVAGKIIWVKHIEAGQTGAKAGDNAVYWDAFTRFGKVDTNDVFIVHVVERSSGKVLARGKIATLIILE